MLKQIEWKFNTVWQRKQEMVDDMLLTSSVAVLSERSVLDDGWLLTGEWSAAASVVSELWVVRWLSSDEMPNSSFVLLEDEFELFPMYLAAFKLRKFLS